MKIILAKDKGEGIFGIFFGKINRFSQSISESVGLLIKAAIRYASHKIITIFSLWSLFKRTNSHPHLGKYVSVLEVEIIVSESP